MRTIYLICHKNRWEQAKLNGVFTHESLESEGFIHLSRGHQIIDVANKHYRKYFNDELLLIQINAERVTSPIKYEQRTSGVYPHIYGTLNCDAATTEYPLIFNTNNQSYVLPSELVIVGSTLLRPALLGDEAEVTNSHFQSWREAYAGIMPDERLSSLHLNFRSRMLGWRMIILNEELAKLFIAESEKHGIVCFSSASKARDAERSHQGELSSIYGVNAYRGMGIGSELFKMASRYLISLGFQQAYLWVLKDNPTTHFYRKMGAYPTTVEKTEDFNGKPLIEIIYEWDLKSFKQA